MANVVRAALVQATWTGDTASMIAKHEEHAREAARQGARIIGFQEVFNSPYFCQVQEPEHYRWAEPVPDGPTVRRMRELARETGMVIVVPVFEVEQSGLYYNTAAVVDADGSYLGKYRKHHIPQVKASGRSTTSSPATSAGPSSTPRPARSASTSATTATSRSWRQLGLNAPSSSTTPPPPTAACPPTCGGWNSPRPPSPTSTSSPRSTASAARSTATTTSTGRVTSSTRADSSSVTSPTTPRRNSSSATSTSTSSKRCGSSGPSTATAAPTPTKAGAA